MALPIPIKRVAPLAENKKKLLEFYILLEKPEKNKGDKPVHKVYLITKNMGKATNMFKTLKNDHLQRN